MKKKMMYVNNGYEAEHYVGNELTDYGCKVFHRNLHYDIECYLPDGRKRKYEIKSCKFYTHTKQFKRDFGRFDFKYKNNWNKMIKENIWLVFVVYIKDKYEIVGIVNPKKLKHKRWITINEVMSNRHIKSWESHINKLRL